ncbi:MAG: ornithine carbamoyltransferase [bacterium]
MTRDYLCSADYDAAKMMELFDLAAAIKALAKRRRRLSALKGYTAALVFQKPSLRTRVTFDIGMRQLGGDAIFLGPSEISLGARESIHDIAKNLERWVDIIIARVFEQTSLEHFAAASAPPVINALSNDEHPCQAMADLFTLYEKGVKFEKTRFAFIGDGNNVCASLMIAGASLGMDVRVATPEGYEPSAVVIEKARSLARESCGGLLVTNDPRQAVSCASAVYTDTWASMHTEHEAQERRPLFTPFQVNPALLKGAEPDAVIMHCLPAHRGEEITDEVMDCKNSIVFDQAENRLHMQKAIILDCLGAVEEARREITG